MPSQATLNQSLLFAMSEGLLMALLSQRNDEALSGILERIKSTHRAFVGVTSKEPGGQYTRQEIQRSAKKLDQFRKDCGVIDQMLDATGPCSMLIGLLNDQLAFVRHPVKRSLILSLQAELENLMWYLDPAGEYDSAEGLVRLVGLRRLRYEVKR